MDLVKRFYPRSSKNSIANENKFISLYRKRSNKSKHHRNKVLLSNSDDSEEEEENGHSEDNRMELYKKKHQQKIKAVETHNDIQRLNKSIQLIGASNDSDDSFYHYHTYPNHYAVNREYHAIPSSLNHPSSATEKKNKQVDTCAKL